MFSLQNRYAFHYRSIHRTAGTLVRVVLTLWMALGLSACASSFPPEPSSTPQATSTPEPPTATPEPMTLTVNGDGVTLVDFNAEVQRYLTSQQALGKTVSTEEATATVKDDLTAQLLLAEAARTNGFTLDDTALQNRIAALAGQVGG